MDRKKKIILFDIDYTVFDTDLFKHTELRKFTVYAEVHDTLAKLSKIAELGVFSEGVIAFQRRKLHETNIEKYFLEKHIHLVTHKSEVIEHLLEHYKNLGQLFLVDDKLSILQLAAQHLSTVYTIWVKRGFYATGKIPLPDFTANATVENLRDVIPYIENA